MRDIILASASPRRSELLKLLNIDFRIIPADIDETADFADTAQAAEIIACRKARHIAKSYPDSVIIAADTVVEAPDGSRLGKPETEADARRMLSMLSGETHSVYSGICVICDGQSASAVCKTDVSFRRITDEEIDAYIACGEPLDKAGAYGIQGRGAVFVEEIKGDFYNVVGLPICKLYQILKNFNII